MNYGLILRFVMLCAGLALVASIPTQLKLTYVDLTYNMLVLVFLCCAWNLVAGFAGQLSFANGAFYGIGALVTATAFLEWNLTPYLGILLGAAVAAAYGGVLGVLAFRRAVSGLYFAILSLAFAFVALGFARVAPVLDGASGAFLPADVDAGMFLFENRNIYFYIMLGLCVGVVGGTALLDRSKLGYQWKAVRENERAAQAVGIAPFRHKLVALTLSAGLTAIAGGISVCYLLYFSPGLHFEFSLNLQILLATLIGGIGTVWGPVLGAVFVQGLDFWLRRGPLGDPDLTAAPPMIVATIMGLVALFLPGGIVGGLRRIRGRHGMPGRARRAAPGADDPGVELGAKTPEPGRMGDSG